MVKSLKKKFGSTVRQPENIVLTLDPAFFQILFHRVLGGLFRQKGEMRRVPYGKLGFPLPLPDVVAQTVENLDQAIRLALKDCTKTVWVVGWSEGAQVIDKWIRERGETSTFPAERLRFVCVGDPEREFGGALRVLNPPIKIVGKPRFMYGSQGHPLPGIPDDTRFTVYSIAREFDGWASLPMKRNPSKDAVNMCSDAIHMNYFSAPKNAVSYRKPGTNITYILIPADPRPAEQIISEFQYPAWEPRIPADLEASTPATV